MLYSSFNVVMVIIIFKYLGRCDLHIWNAFFNLVISFSQVRHLDTSEKSELYKLQQLKDEQGVLCILFVLMFLFYRIFFELV